MLEKIYSMYCFVYVVLVIGLTHFTEFLVQT